ncbi:hypothetical protein OG216_03670 [Streptomycetaceae bacterium NBC_01309]
MRARRTAASALAASLVVVGAGVIALRYGGTEQASGAMAPKNNLAATTTATATTAGATPGASAASPDGAAAAMNAGPRPSPPGCASPTASVGPGGQAACPDPVDPLGLFSVPHGDGRTALLLPFVEGATPPTAASDVLWHLPGTVMPGGQGISVLVIRLAENSTGIYPEFERIKAGVQVGVSFGERAYAYRIDARADDLASSMGFLAPQPPGSPYTTPGAYVAVVVLKPDGKAAHFVAWGSLVGA